MVRWVGTHVAALICKVSPSTIRRWCDDGLIPPAHWQQPADGRHRKIDREFLVTNLVLYVESRSSRNVD